MIELQKRGDVHIATMNNGANMVEPQWLSRMLEVLDAVEADSSGNAALVIVGEGKSFSNGLNVEVIMNLQGDALKQFGESMSELFRRLLRLPIPTVAALNGHAFAAGAFLALTCDYRLMREDRGWFCISEVDVGVPISEAMMRLLQGKTTPNTARDAVLTGKRYTADEAIAAGLADGKAPENELLEQCLILAGSLAMKERNIFTALKQCLNKDLIAQFEPA